MLNETLSACLSAQVDNPDDAFLKVYEYICKSLSARYGKRMTETRLEDLTSHVTVYVLKLWVDPIKGYDPSRGVKPTSYAHRAIIWATRNFFERREERETQTFSELSDITANQIEAPAESDEPETDPEAQAERIANVVKFILNTATPRQRDVFELRIQGYTFAEISTELGISRQAVTVHACRLRELARKWEKGERMSDD